MKSNLWLDINIVDISYDVLDSNEDLLNQLSAQFGLPTYLDEDLFSHTLQPVDKVIPTMDMQEMDMVPDINMEDTNIIPHTGNKEETPLTS